MTAAVCLDIDPADEEFDGTAAHAESVMFLKKIRVEVGISLGVNPIRTDTSLILVGLRKCLYLT